MNKMGRVGEGTGKREGQRTIRAFILGARRGPGGTILTWQAGPSFEYLCLGESCVGFSVA